MEHKAVKLVQPANEDLILSLESPGFSMRYPTLFNKELMQPQMLAMLEATWKREHFPARQIQFHRVRNVAVVEEGLVFDERGALYRTSITQHAEAGIRKGLAAAQTAYRSGAVSVHKGVHLLCKKRGAGNYGHWLMEMLPRAYLGSRHVGALRYVVPKAEPQLELVISTSLDLLGITPDAILCVGHEPHLFEELILVDGLTEHGVYMAPLVVDCARALSALVSSRRTERLYVTRSATGFRDFVNEPEIRELLESHGYLTVDTGTLPLVEQIGLFKAARRVVGIMGAAMTNIAFCPANACILNIAPAGMPDTFFWFIAGLKGLHYFEARCRQVGPVRGVMRWDTNIEFDHSVLLDNVFL